MRLKFGPDDEAEFDAASRQLVARFEASPFGHGLGWAADQVLQFKWGYLDGDLGAWHEGDIAQILFELFPRKVTLDPQDRSGVIRGFAQFLRFLAAEGLVDEARASRLVAVVERNDGAFADAMADESRFGLGKRLLAAMT